MDHLLSRDTSHKSLPLYQQIYWQVKSAVTQGILHAGDRIPSARAIAKDWGVARGTAEEAYQLLKDEGIIVAKGPAGCFIAATAHPPKKFAEYKAVAPSTQTQQAPEAHWFQAQQLMPFQMGIPALDAFPLKRWQGLGRMINKSIGAHDLCNPPRQGLITLREQIAKYLAVARGVEASVDQIFITNGYRQSLSLIANAVGGSRAWVEDPGYPPTRDLLKATGYQCATIPVDKEGMDVEYAKTHFPSADLCVVTPAHQSPLCCSMSRERRQSLLQWASQNCSWIVEDDYDGEYRLASRPLPSLKSLDTDERVIYMGTFSKVLVPAIRLAYFVVPPSLVKSVQIKQQALMDSQPLMTQKQLTEFMATGQFARHIQKMRRLYRERRAVCVEAFSTVFDEQLRIDDQPGGMHFIARINSKTDDKALAKLCLRAGIYANPLSIWCFNHHQQGLLMSYTNAQNLDETLELVVTMKKAINL